MKKRIIALSVAAAVGGFAGSVSAQTPPAPATGLDFNPAGVGHINIVPYFSTQNGNVTAINIVNTDTVHGKVVKVRFRGASNSDDVYDFQLFLSPGDVWAAGVSTSDGGSMLTTADKSCTLPASVNGAFIASRTKGVAAGETKEGYVEILNMGDIVEGPAKSNKLALYTATKHVNGVAPCTSSTLTAIKHTNASDYMDPPTTGLFSNWTIINVTNKSAYSGASAAIEARDSSGMAGTGLIVFSEQTADLVSPTEAKNYTADPLLTSGGIKAARYDFPDLSTPYTSGAATPDDQAFDLSSAFAVQTVSGEFYNLASVGASTDWVVSFPTRRYFAVVKYGADEDVPVYTTSPLNIYFNEDNTTLVGYQLCQNLGQSAVKFWNREETPAQDQGVVISPGDPKTLNLCGEVAVVGINNPSAATSATYGSLTRSTISNGFVEGWGAITTPSDTTPGGLPMLVNQFTRVNNQIDGVYYGLNYPGRVLIKGVVPAM
jgi:hypothetical protein